MTRPDLSARLRELDELLQLAEGMKQMLATATLPDYDKRKVSGYLIGQAETALPKARDAIAALHTAPAREADWPECEQFYNLMQAYRHASLTSQADVIAAYEAVKAFVRAPAEGEAVFHASPDSAGCGRVATHRDWLAADDHTKEWYSTPLYTKPTPSAAVVRDAERYRWIRRQRGYVCHYDPDTLDAAVDVGRKDTLEDWS